MKKSLQTSGLLLSNSVTENLKFYFIFEIINSTSKGYGFA